MGGKHEEAAPQPGRSRIIVATMPLYIAKDEHALS